MGTTDNDLTILSFGDGVLAYQEHESDIALLIPGDPAPKDCVSWAGYSWDVGLNPEQSVAISHPQGLPAKIAFEEPENMAPVYRDHDWLVYTSDVEMNTVGLPAAVVEAQASGIGVCLQELPGRREAQLDFLGGGGHLFKKIDEVPDLLSEPYPEELRMKGFASSLRSDVRAHKSTLDDIWALAKP